MLCSPTQITLVTENFEQNLQEVLSQGVPGLKPNSESEVWSFLFDIAEAIKFLSNVMMDHFFLHTMTIFRDQQTKKWKVIPSLFYSKNNFSMAQVSEEHFASPEMYRQIKSGEKCFIDDVDKSSVYSLGLILLKIIYQENFDTRQAYSLKTLTP